MEKLLEKLILEDNYGNNSFYPSNFSFSSSTSNLTISLTNTSLNTLGTYGVSVLVLL